ncbi:Maltose permease MAL31, partial [Colletotrichum shisoi]
YGAFDAELGRYAIPSNKLSVGTGTGSAGIIIGCVIAPVVTSKLGRKMAFVIIIVILCQLIVPLGYVSFWFFLPESPRFLIYRGRFDEAEVVLRSLSNHPETVPQEIDLLKAQVEEQRRNHAAVTVLDCFRGTNLRRTVIAMSNFIVTFMQQLGFPDALRTNVIVTGCGFAVYIITFLTLDKIGRRRSLSWGAVTAAEVSTGQLRERTLFLASIGSFVTSVPINFTNPYVQRAIGGSVTFIYGGFSVLATLWVLMMVPETKNRSLEELDDMFQAKGSTRQSKTYYCTGLGANIAQIVANRAVNKDTTQKEEVEEQEPAQ